MTSKRRLDKLDTSLTPTELVVRWLDEAHAHGGFVAYTESLLDLDAEQFPLMRLMREARRSAQAAPGRREDAVPKAVRETVFRFFLVLRINVTAHEQLEKEILIHAALAAYLGALAGMPARKHDDDYRARIGETSGLLLALVAEMEARSAARALAEERYLAARSALFPDIARVCEDQLQTTRESGALAIRLAELDGVDVTTERASDDRVDRLLADLVLPSKAIALEKLGEGSRGLPIAVKWLRARYRSAGGAPCRGK